MLFNINIQQNNEYNVFYEYERIFGEINTRFVTQNAFFIPIKGLVSIDKSFTNHKLTNAEFTALTELIIFSNSVGYELSCDPKTNEQTEMFITNRNNNHIVNEKLSDLSVVKLQKLFQNLVEERIAITIEMYYCIDFKKSVKAQILNAIVEYNNQVMMSRIFNTDLDVIRFYVDEESYIVLN